jgi:hypothetical protein
MRVALLASLLLSFALASGCKQQENSSTTGASPSATAAASRSMTPEQLGELGAQIKKEPGRAHELLSEHGLTEESFDKAIRQVTQDPAASKRYAAAFKKASG